MLRLTEHMRKEFSVLAHTCSCPHPYLGYTQCRAQLASSSQQGPCMPISCNEGGFGKWRLLILLLKALPRMLQTPP